MSFKKHKHDWELIGIEGSGYAAIHCLWECSACFKVKLRYHTTLPLRTRKNFYCASRDHIPKSWYFITLFPPTRANKCLKLQREPLTGLDENKLITHKWDLVGLMFCSTPVFRCEDCQHLIRSNIHSSVLLQSVYPDELSSIDFMD
jgi:hypothetical protein